MAGRGLYQVGKNAQFKTIQRALDALIEDQGYVEFSREQRIVIQDSDIYEKIIIPADSLLPTSTARLIIEGAEGQLPVIDGSLEPDRANYGIQIGSSLHFITIRRLQIQNFFVGVLVNAGSTYANISQCLIRNNLNAGILAFFADNFTADNNIIMGADYCLALDRCKNVAIVGNTLFNDGTIKSGTSTNVAALVCKLAPDYGAGTSDTGYAWIRNNIITHITDNAAIFFDDDIARAAILSDYNCLYAPNSNTYLVLKDGTHTKPIKYPDLESVRNHIGLEKNSIGSDPLLFKPILENSEFGSYELDLQTLAHSPVIDKGEIYNPNAPLSMPTWIDSTLFVKDFDNDTRAVNERPTIGALDSDGIFSLIDNPSSAPDFVSCKTDPLQRILDSFQLSLWNPEIQNGTFFVAEKEYYLYADKQAYRLSDIAITVFDLSVSPADNQPITVKAGTETISDDSWDLAGRTFTLFHKGLNIANYHQEVSVEGKYRIWDGGAFFYTKFFQRMRIADGITSFILNEPYVLNGAPVVITDDKASLHDNDGIVNEEFIIRHNTEFDAAEVIFCLNRNKLQNPQFDYNLTGWYTTTGVYLDTNFNSQYPYAGDYICMLSGSTSGSAIISQQNRTALYSGERLPSILTWHATAATDETANWFVHQYDDKGSNIYSITGSFNVTNEWNRYRCILGEADPDLTGIGPLVIDVGGTTLKSDTLVTEVGLLAANGTTIFVDAIQLEPGDTHTEYHRLPNFYDMTVEYEGSASGVYLDKCLSMSPIRNPNNNGFLAIQNLPATIFDKSATTATTLHEYRWPEGRLNVLPWSRLTGRDKLKRTVSKSLSTSAGLPLKDPHVVSRQAATISISPSSIQALQGTDGEWITVEVFDADGNPYSFQDVNIQVYDYAGEYPGILLNRELSIPVARDMFITKETDSAGKVNVLWTPPTKEDIEYIGPKPTNISDTSGNVFINTKYKTSPINYGNVSLKKTDGTFQPIAGTTEITGSFAARADRGFSYITLPYLPVFNTVQVFHNNEEWHESLSYQPGEQEFQVLYRQHIVKLNGTVNGQVDIKFKRMLAWTEEKWGRRIFINENTASSLGNNDISINYDAELLLRVSVDNLVKEFILIAQNPEND